MKQEEKRRSLKKVFLIVVLLLIIGYGLFVFSSRLGEVKEKIDLDEKIVKNQTAANRLSELEGIHLNLDVNDIPKLKEIIKSDTDSYVRERAIFVLTDISIQKNVTTEAIDFLKDIAHSEKNDEVRTAAYSNLDLIRETVPPPIEGELDFRIEGDIKKGGDITIFLRAIAYQDSEATVFIKRLSSYGDNERVGLSLVGRNKVNFPLKSGESNEFPFTLAIDENGEYLVIGALKLSLDRVDYRVIEKQIYLKVDETEGSYKEL